MLLNFIRYYNHLREAVAIWADKIALEEINYTDSIISLAFADKWPLLQVCYKPKKKCVFHKD